jgi:Rod binding domain-containing protein
MKGKAMDLLKAAPVMVPSSGLDPESLATQLRSDRRPSVDAAATGFESMFLAMILKEMRQTLEGGSFFGEDNADVYGGLFDQYLGDHLAKAGRLGIAAMVKGQYERASATPPSAKGTNGTILPGGSALYKRFSHPGDSLSNHEPKTNREI